MNVQEKIQQLVSNNNVVLFMKGTADFPMCGFSSRVVQILNNLGVDFVGVNILEDEALRQGIKEFSQWPTLPQLYVKGQFVGGCDIVTELFESGELQPLLSKN